MGLVLRCKDLVRALQNKSRNPARGNNFRVESSFKPIFIYFELGPDEFCLALAHELIHHCQYTCRSETCRSVCEYWLNLDKGHEIRETIPYNLRPHEIEAYSKDEEFCRKVRELKEFSEVVKDISNAIQNIKEIITLTIMTHSQTQP